jgi:hypothetical protein
MSLGIGRAPDVTEAQPQPHVDEGGPTTTMGNCAYLLLAAWLAAEPTRTETVEPVAPPDPNQLAHENPKGGAGVSPVELIPRLELREAFFQLPNGVSFHDTVAEVDIQFLRRVLLRYEGPYRVLRTPAGQVSGFGDLQITAIIDVASDPLYVVALITGAILNTASQPPLGDGKQQFLIGAGAAAKPFIWWMPYILMLEQLSLGGDPARPNINQLTTRFGNIVFGQWFSWYKLDLDLVGNFALGAVQFFGTVEAGRLLVGRIGLFMRAGTQLVGPRLLDYDVQAGVRYLFRLGKSGEAF